MAGFYYKASEVHLSCLSIKVLNNLDAFALPKVLK